MRDCLTKRLGRPSRDEAERLSDHVIEAAARLFAARGYAETSMAAVASEARVGKHTVYRRFRDKADLFRAVVDRYAERVLGTDQPEDIPAIARLRDLLLRAARLGNAPATEWVYRIALAEAARFPELSAVLLSNKDLGLKVRLAELVGEAQDEGSLGPGDPVIMGELALEMLATPFLSRRLSGDGLHDDEALIARFDCCWAIFMGGIGASTTVGALRRLQAPSEGRAVES